MAHLRTGVVQSCQQEAEAAGSQLGQLVHRRPLQNGAKGEGGCLTVPPGVGRLGVVDVLLHLAMALPKRAISYAGQQEAQRPKVHQQGGGLLHCATVKEKCWSGREAPITEAMRAA